MCDTLIKAKLSKKEIPKYVYKRVQKVANGKYVTPVMGEPLYKGSWKGAKSYMQPHDGGWKSLVRFLDTKFPIKYWGSSSSWASHHVGKWASFKTLNHAITADLTSNFVDGDFNSYPTIIVKCEIRGDVSFGNYSGRDTYLSSQIRVVEESCKLNY